MPAADAGPSARTCRCWSRRRREGRSGLSKAQARTGIALGGAADSRLSRQMAMPVSGDTILRLVRLLPEPTPSTPTIIGVDDWAMKKRLRYGTITVDLQRHRPIDLLPDRTAETVIVWLESRPGIEIVARDRSTEYRRAITIGARNAVQIADRWHLLHNTRQMVERWAAGAHARLRRLPELSSPKATKTCRTKTCRTKAFRRLRSDADVAAESRTRRLTQYDDVRRRYLAGEAIVAISRATGLSPTTVRKFAYADAFPERAVRATASSIIDPYLPLLRSRLANGCENGLQLWRECRDLGYGGSASQIHRWLQDHRTAPSKHAPHRTVDTAPPAPATQNPVSIPSPKQLAWLIVKAPERRSIEEANAILRISQDRDAAILIRVVRRFVDLVRRVGTKAHDAGPAFDDWLRGAKRCGLRPVETFAAGLQHDGDAVRAALETCWSSAQVEGQVNKLKLLKRSMYGRGNLELLRRRLILAP
ncbi:ISL3 family transposase [Aurantimonas sp. C2-6-R+9]|uniref:ISL3 family transposase n=1 Tax=unclassified Aurantimonas TaxID=2638230 RepID=UPI002E1984A7|nr:MULTISPECIES: ISL3 family transposase [unclassified Aurantimonas]MEC5293813.1 ISL3 family transposase [Aurantimonas sp. C2-3-R2]MEC5383975.1 ISL3 family transposase [Aurantimonas sp. C2-6-R+9]MEC5414874.1 ISL3 family transposase [Aurantimonas sp. C2-4-R8]